MRCFSPATASSHLGKLTEARLLAVQAHGRHRYYRLAGPQFARLIKALQQLAAMGSRSCIVVPSPAPGLSCSPSRSNGTNSRSI